MKGYGDSEAYKKLLREFNSNEAEFLKIAKSPRIPSATMLKVFGTRFNKVFNPKDFEGTYQHCLLCTAFCDICDVANVDENL